MPGSAVGGVEEDDVVPGDSSGWPAEAEVPEALPLPGRFGFGGGPLPPLPELVAPGERPEQSQKEEEAKFAEFFCERFGDLVSEWNPVCTPEGRVRFVWDDDVGAHDVIVEGQEEAASARRAAGAGGGGRRRRSRGCLRWTIGRPSGRASGRSWMPSSRLGRWRAPWTCSLCGSWWRRWCRAVGGIRCMGRARPRRSSRARGGRRAVSFAGMVSRTSFCLAGVRGRCGW